MTTVNIPVLFAQSTGRMCHFLLMCVHFNKSIAIPELDFSSQISSGQLDTFLNAYGALLKSSMSTLRKRDKKREKVRAEKLAARKQRLAEPVPIEGPKRGKGRRKRQRRVKAALKQEAARQRMQEKQEAKEKTV